MLSNRILIAAVLTGLGTGLPGQGDDAPPQPSSTLLVRLKSRNIKLEQATALAGELQLRPSRYRIEASKALRTHFLRRQKSFDKAAARVFAQFAKLTKKAQRGLLGRKGTAKVELLREQSLSVSRQASLSKAQIKNDVDPCMKQLDELLFPKLKDVLALDAKVDPAVDALRSQHRGLVDWHAVYASMTEGMELSEDAAKHFKKLPMPQHPGDRQRIDRDLEFAMFAGLPMSGTANKVLQQNEADRASTPHQEYLGTLELNRMRYLLGLSLVRIDAKLSDAARDHSKDMHTLGFFSHTSPVKGKERFSQRAANFGTSASAENIASGQSTGHGAIRAWWYSPGHHRNMLSGGHNRTGLGQFDNKWTQLFGG